MNEKKQYIVQIPGKEHVAYWDEDTYAANQEKLYSDYPDAEVTSMSVADPYGDMQDNDQFAVVIPGKEHVAQWDAKTLAANRDKLLQDFGNAQVYRLNNETLQRDMDFIQQYDDASSRWSVENWRFTHDNADRYKSVIAKYSRQEEEETETEGKKGSFIERANNFFGGLNRGEHIFGAVQNLKGLLGGAMYGAAEVLRGGLVSEYNRAGNDLIWEAAKDEFQRRQDSWAGGQQGEAIFQNEAEPSTAERAGWSKDDARAYNRQKQANKLIDDLRKEAEEKGEDPEKYVAEALQRGVDSSIPHILQDAATKIIENSQAVPMTGVMKVGGMIPLVASSVGAVALAATGNYAGAQALGEATMATFAASAAGNAMKQARDAGASDAQTNLAGLVTAGIFYGMGKIPLNRAINGVITSSAAKAMGNVEWMGLGKEAASLFEEAARNGLIRTGSEKAASKMLAQEFLENWGAQVASHTASFSAMSAVQAMVPLIYEDPDKYPLLNNVLNAAKEGAIDGLVLGALTGGFTAGNDLALRMRRWRGRDQVSIASVQFDDRNPPEVFEYNRRTNSWEPSGKLQYGARYFAEVISADPRSEKPITVLINDGGTTKMARIAKEDVRFGVTMKPEEIKDNIIEINKDQGFEQGRNAQTPEQIEGVRNEHKYQQAKSRAEEQSGGVSEGTRLDMEKANAAMEGRREAVRDQIQQRTGQQFWKTENISVPSEDGQAMMLQQENVVDAVTLADGRQIFIVGEDETSLAYVDETGANRLIDKNSQEIVSRQRYTLDEYLDGRVQAQDAEAEQQRMQAEQVQNLEAVQQAIAEQGDGASINIGTQEEENWVPIVGMDTTPQGGIVIQVDGVEQPMTWKEVAARLGVPMEPKTGDDLVQERLSADAQVNKYNGIPQGAELQVPVEGAEPMIYKFRSAELVDGDIIIRAEDPMSGDVVDLTPDIINNLDVLTEKPQPLPDGVTYGPVLETQQRKNGTTVEIRAKTETKNGVSTTTAIGMRDGAEVGMPTAFMPMPEGLQIKEDYMSIFEDEDGKPRNGVELLGVHEVREGDNGAGQHVIGATIVVRDENGVTTYDVALERTTPPAEDVSTQIFDDPAANQLGITKDYAFTTKGGQTVVNGRKLWDENPRLWAKWNDANPDRNVTTKDFLESKMQGINAEVSKARTNLEMEAKGNQDPDKLLELREKLNGKELRRQEVQTLLDEYIAAEKALQEAAEAEERARKEAEDAAKAAAFQAELEAQRQERERKEAEHQVLMSQDEAFRARTEDYQAAKKYVGRATKVNVAGEQYPAHFVLMEAGTPLTSHDPLNNFTPTEGFGVDEQGRNLNTRAYDKEVEEQEGARAIGRHPDYRLIEYMPVVTYEGRAVSGNKRLSGRKLAAADGTDADLIKEYRDARGQFDFTDEQLAEFEHPVIVKQLDEPVPYTAKFFDAFNQSIGTAASTVALAAKVAKMTDEVLINRVANLFVGIDDIQKVYQNPEAINSLFNILEAEKISPREDRPRYIDAEGKLTGAGEDFVESLLFGSIFSASDEAVRLAMADKSIRRAVAFAFPTLVRTRNLKGEYSIIKEMTDAVTILAQAKADNQGKPEGAIEYYLLQPDLFTGETPVVAATTQLLARVLNDKKYGSLRKVLDQYIPRAELANEGQLGFNFDGEEGILETKEDILSDVLKQNNIDIRTYGRTEAAAAEPELPANDEVYPPSGEYGGGRAEIERPAVESAGGLQAEGNTAAEVAARDAEVAGRIADILSGKDTKRYKPSYEYDSGVNVPDKFIDEVSRQWDEHKSAVEAQRKPLQKRVSELVDSFQKGAEAEIKAKNPNVGETTLHNASIDIVDRKIKDSQEYQDLVKQIDALDEQVSPKTKDRFRQNAIGMLYADYAEAPTQNGLDQLFSMLGTTREQAYQDRLQAKLSDIDQRINANPEQKATLVEERTAAIQEFIDANVSVDGIRRVVTTEANLPSAMTEAGYSPAQIQKVETAIAKAALTHDVPRSFIYNGGIFVITDNIKSAKSADTAHAHEEEHFITNGNGDADSLLKMEGASRKSLLNAIDSWVGYVENYHDGSDSYVANEFISHAIERAKDLPEDEQVKMLAKAGINSEEIVNLVKNRVNERRNRSRELRAEAGRRSGTDAHDLGGTPLNAGQDGGNPQEGAGSRLDIQRPGSADSGLRGNTGGEIAAAERRAAERTPQYKPAEERRLRAVDSLGSPKPEVISEIGKDTTEGTALFSLDKDDKTLVGIHNIDANVLGKAIRMGGLANPSAAVIDLSRQNHFDYGDVSLIMPASLVDKSSGENIGTYDRDAWTPTYPTIKYFESKQSRERLKKLIKDLPKDLQYDLSYKVEGYLNGDIYNSGLEYLFLKEKGMEIGMQTKPRRYPYATVDDFMVNYLKAPGLKWGDSSGFMDAYRALSEEDRLKANVYMTAYGNPDSIQKINERIENYGKKYPAFYEGYVKEKGFADIDSFLYTIMRDERDAGEESTGLTIEKAIEVIKDKGLQEEFGHWQDMVIESLGFDEKFFDGYTPSGNRRYKAHTLENVSAWMKKQGRNASKDHGLVMTSGTIMAKMAKKFTSLTQIRRAKSRLVPSGEAGKEYQEKIEDVRERIKNLVISFWSDKLSRQSGLLTGELVALDYVQDFLILGKDLDSVVKNYNETEHENLSLSEEEKAAFNTLREDIRNLPVHYFETKFERPVYLDEFAAAVVPTDTPADIKEQLKNDGLSVFEYDRNDKDSRRQAVIEASKGDGIMFSFMGTVGAARLDAAEGREDRMSDLYFARQMDGTRDPHAIKLATGWEKGLDGKWRYEKRDFKEYDPDGNIQYKKRHPELARYEELLGKSNKALFFPEENEPLTETEQTEFNKLSAIYGRKPGDWTGKGWKTPYHNSSKLPDYIDDEELFTAYPELRDTRVKFEKLPDDTGGYFSMEKNTLVMNENERYHRTRAEDIIIHEIQHKIQDIEGFSAGTNMEEAKRKANLEQPKRNLLDNNQKEFMRSVKLWMGNSMAWKQSVPLASYLGQVSSRIGEDYYKSNLEGKNENDVLREYNRLVVLNNSAQRLTPMEIYAATSGEVEARNVERRRRIGFQDTRRVLSEETEDIARKDQILNMPEYDLLDVDGLTESLKTAQQKTNKVPGSKAMSIELDDDVNLMQTTDNQAAKDLASRYDNQDGDKYPWMSEGELIDAIEKELPYGKDTKPVFALIDEYRRLDAEDFEEGRRDFSGGEKQDLFEKITGELRSLGDKQETVMFSLTRNNKTVIDSWLKKRSDLKEEDRAAVMEYLEELNDSRTQLAAGRWFAAGTIRLPEDMPKVEQAISVAGKAKVDPLKYDSPMALLDAHADFKPTEKRIDPNTVNTLHKVKEFNEQGIVIYDVDDSEESRQNMRQIINTHYGKDASPWCLLQGDGEGNLTDDSNYYWGVYNAYPKQVAFKDGKLLAFSANDSEEIVWWDRQDSPHSGIPVDRKIPNDYLGRTATYELDADGLLANPTNIHKGNKQNGAYTEWFGLGEDNISKEENYLNGKKHGKSVAYRANGLVKAEEYYENGEPVGEQVWYYDNGNLQSKGVYDRRGRLLRSESYWTNGQMKLLINYQDSQRHGLTKEWYENGNPLQSSYWVNGQREGVHEAYFRDGKLKERSEYKNGRLNGVEEDWNEKGFLVARIEYKDGQRHGKTMLFYNGGQPYEEKYYINGVANGIYRHWDADGILTNEYNYKDNRPDGPQKRFWHRTGGPLEFSNYKDGVENGVTRTWNQEGELISMVLMENGRQVRDLLAEGVTEEDADNLNFSFVTDEKELERLEKEPTITLYRAMAQIDGKLYPPMSTKEPNGPGQKGQKLKLRQPSELGRWERSDEAPDKAKQGKDGKWYFDLKKGNGGDVNGVLYNPYFHTSASPLNDQFSGAINYPELVTVAVEVPISELGSGYRADKANDTVGPKDWHSGTVTGQLGEGRQVVLTRWAKPTRIIPDSEVASIIAPKLIDKKIVVPSNVVTPSLKAELEKRGVVFDGKASDYKEPAPEREENPIFSLVNENQEIFVSNAAKAVESIKNDKATPEQWLKQLEKNGGLKAGEDKWIGLSDWLKSQDRKSLTKQEVLDYINEHRIQIEEVHYLENNPKVAEALERYNREMRSYMQDPDELYEYADRQLAEFYLDMEEKYGENYLYEMTESEQAAENQLLQARDDASSLEPEEEAFRQMVNKYGDDFEQAFSLDGDELEINTGYDGEPDPAAMHFLELEGASERPINDTRLEYTTPGLDNKHEIALTVPTIEPWNTSDNVHFGDAGEGRTVAWIRFGDATDGIISGEPERAHEFAVLRNQFRGAIKNLEDKLRRGVTGRTKEDAEKNLADMRSKLEKLEQNYSDLHAEESRVLVIDEIQSKRHQEGREKGYRDIEKENAIEKKYGEADLLYHETLSRLVQKYPNFAPEEGGRTHPEVLSEVDRRGLQDVRDARKTALEEYKKYFDTYGYPKSIPGAPFEKNWHELAMKRMLRYAAGNGYDAVAWTTGAQQAERYNLGKSIDYIEYTREFEGGEVRYDLMPKNNTGSVSLFVKDGIVTKSYYDELAGKPLEDVVGKAVAQKMLEMKQGDKLNAEDLHVGGEGMRGFYDDILPRFMNKYGKKWGVSVKDVFIPGIGETMNGLTMHSVPVTDEMKESVMGGQPMFSMVKDDKLPVQGELFGEDNEPVRYESLGGLPKGEGRNSIVERTFRKSKAFSFTGKERIESAADVAYIFKELEDSAVENAFLVFVKDGVPTIIHAGIGNISSVGIDTAPLLVGIKDFAPDRIYMVHNHPSGRVEASAADVTELRRIAEAAEGVPVEGIIIDTISGEYGQFDDTVMGSTLVDTRPSDNEQQDAIPLDVLTFDKMVFSPDYWKEINSQNPITGAKDVAEYISAHRLGEGSKINALLLDRQNKVVGNLVLNTNVLSKDNAREQARHIVDAANRSAASAVILNGDFQFDKATIFTLKNGIDTYGVGKVSFMDMVKVDGMRTQSLMEGTLRDDTPGRIIKPLEEKSVLAERAEAIKQLTPVEVKKTTKSREELRKEYVANEPVEKDGRLIHFYRGGFNKSYRQPLFRVVINKAHEILDGAVLAYTEQEDASIIGKTRPDGSAHTSRRNVIEYRNYVNKVNLDGEDYYVRFMVFWGTGDSTAPHYTRVSNVELYKENQPSVRRLRLTDGLGSPWADSDTNLQQFFELASNSENILRDSRQSDIQAVAESGKSGFAKVIGEDNLEPLYNKIYRAIPKDILKPIVGDAVNDGLQIRKHLDRYLHDLAKNGTENDETGLLRAIYSEVRAYTGNPALTDGDIRYMLWKATSEAKDGDMLSLIEDLAMRGRWGAGSDEPMFSMRKDFADTTDEAREKLDERLDEAGQAAKDAAKTLRTETLKAIKENEGKDFKSRLLPITKAMSAQKQYDRATVDGIVKFAKEILKNGNVDSLTYRETNRLLALVNSANGKSPAYATRYSEQLLDLLLDHIVKKEAGDFNALVNVKDKTTNQKGVETLGKIDLRGQETMKAFRDSRKLTQDEIEERLLDISVRMDDPSDAVRAHAFAEYEGVELARQYQNGLGENLKEADELERELEYEKEARKTGNIEKKVYDEYVRSTNEAIRENKMERVDLYRDFSNRLVEIISGGSARAKAFREANKLRIEAIHHDANRDMKGISTKEHRSDSRVDRLINSDVIRFLFKPLATFDQMLRVIGRRNMSGEGYLWNRFMRGWVDAAERSYDGLFKATDELDKKASEVFGKKMRWSEIYEIERKMPKATVKFMDGGDPVEHELTAGNLLYIYMVDKMVDGRMKLRKMGIDESMVQEIKNNLDPRFIQLADWVQEDFLVRMRNKYNEVHERMFGAPMADIQDYFPLKILANARIEEVDLGNRPDGNPLSSTTTGSIIKRRKNSLALDLLHADAFSLVIEHLQQMEDWAAFAEYRRDLNSLLSYKRFRNQLQNMRTIYGTGKALWSNFKDVASMASGSYKPKVGKGDVDTVVLNISKGVTAAKINFRVNTALKQLLSAPAYLAEANIGDLAKSLAKPGASWNWCMENLPVFKKRWKSHLAGDTRLMDTESDWEIWRKNAIKTAGRLGMAPNAFVDAATVAIGAKAMYDTKYRRYIESGYSETAADRRAKQDATILYNQTQQSNENPFVSPMQLDRTMLSVMLTTFRNASMGYQRQLHDAIRGLGREFDDMSKQERIDFMAEQGKNAGADEEQAKTGAEKEYGRQKWRNLIRIAIFGFGLQFLWNLGADIWYEIFGEDEKKKKKTLWNAALKMLAGPIEGLAGGNIISDAWGIISSGQSLRNIGFGELPIVSDAKTILQELEYDQPAAVNDVINLIAQSATGVNPETITDIAVAVIDACDGDLGTAKEVALLMMRIAQIPQSTIDEFFIDEIGMSAKKAKRLNPSELAKRYAEYKMNKNAPLTQGLYDEKTEARRRKSYEKKFKDKVKERK